MARQRNSSSTGEDMDLPKCTICHSILEQDICITHCGHRFCRGCIMQWLNRKKECPTCRTRLTADKLIQDRELPEVISKLRELQCRLRDMLLNENAGSTVSTTDSAGGDTSPEWIQHMDINKKLLKRKDDAIADQTKKRELAERKVQQLTDETAQLKVLIASVPTLNEKIRQLEAEVQTEKRNRSILQGKLQEATTKDAASRSSITMLKSKQSDFEKKETSNVAQIQKLIDDLVHIKEENQRLISENTTLEGELQDELTKVDEMKAENETLNAQLQTAVQTNNELTVERELTKKEAFFILNHMKQLEIYKQTSNEKAIALLELNNNVLPQRNHHNDELENQVARLIDELATVRRDTIPLSEHTLKIQTEVQQTKDNLQKSYEVARDTARAYDEENRKTWQNRLTSVQSQLKSMDERNMLSSATPCYKKLVKKNFELEDTVKFLRKKLFETQCRLPQDTDVGEWVDREN